jgi:hypothetical protein
MLSWPEVHSQTQSVLRRSYPAHGWLEDWQRLGMNRTGQLQAAVSKARAGKKFQRKPQLQNVALKPCLLPEVAAHDGEVVFCETSYYFMLKVIGGSSNGGPVTFLVRRTAFFDCLF